MPRFTIPIDPRSIQAFQTAEVIGAAGTDHVHSPIVPAGINRMIFHLHVLTDDIGASRKLGVGLLNEQNLFVGIPCSLDGVVINEAGMRSVALTEIWMPTGFQIQAGISGAVITAGKIVVLQYYYIDILKI